MAAGGTPVAAVLAVVTAAAAVAVVAVATTTQGAEPRVMAVWAAPSVWQPAAVAVPLQMASVVTGAMPAVPVRMPVALTQRDRAGRPAAERLPEPVVDPVWSLLMRAEPAAAVVDYTAPLI
jgi:hypothetical protein